MKKILSAIVLSLTLLFGNFLHAQIINSESFSSTTSSWQLSTNFKIVDYSRPGTCDLTDHGIQSPGIGGKANIGMISPELTFDSNNPYLIVHFKIFVFDASSKDCATKNFICTPKVDVYIVPTTWNRDDRTPSESEYLAYQSYSIMNANANNSIIFSQSQLNKLTHNGKYKVMLNFRSANTECNAGNTKYLFDDFSIFKANCSGSCAPIANNDYFNGELQNFTTTVNGNVFGGYALWSSQAPTGFEINSLSFTPAANNGTDYDLNNLNLDQVTFTQVGTEVVEYDKNCSSNRGTPGTLQFTNSGTFSYTRLDPCVTRVIFYYKINQKIAPFLESATTAQVTIDFGKFVVLPVEFKLFSALRNPQRKEQVLLKWETVTEESNRGFYVQRKVNGQWKNIAFVFSQADNGNSNSDLAYEYKEINTISGVSQYQIQQVDMDGKTSYSEIRSVGGLNQASSVQVFPNPGVDGKVSLLFKDSNSPKDVIVNDINGRMVKQFKAVKDNSLNIDGLQSGFYTIKVTDLLSATTTVEKVIIKK